MVARTVVVKVVVKMVDDLAALLGVSLARVAVARAAMATVTAAVVTVAALAAEATVEAMTVVEMEVVSEVASRATASMVAKLGEQLAVVATELA